MSSSPLVTVGVPVFNGERYLRGCLEALLAQDFEDFEIFVSDNDSTDGTRAIAEEFVARDPRVRYHKNDENLGAARNYNQLVATARGQFFRWQTYDDLVAPEFLGRCLDAYASGPEDTVLVYPRTTLIDAAGEVIGPYDDNSEVLQPRPHQRLAHLLRVLHLCNAVLGLHRTETLRKTRVIDLFRSSDVVLLAEVAMLGRIVEVPERLFYRRRDEELPSPANLDGGQQAAWFDPRGTGSPFFRTALFSAHLSSSLRLPPRLTDRLLCCWAVLRVWGPRHWRVMGGEFKIWLKRQRMGR